MDMELDFLRSMVFFKPPDKERQKSEKRLIFKAKLDEGTLVGKYISKASRVQGLNLGKQIFYKKQNSDICRGFLI